MKLSEFCEHRDLILKAEKWLDMLTEDTHPTVFDHDGTLAVYWWV